MLSIRFGSDPETATSDAGGGEGYIQIDNCWLARTNTPCRPGVIDHDAAARRGGMSAKYLEAQSHIWGLARGYLLQHTDIGIL